MPRKRKRGRGIALPWENRGTWMRRLLAGPRWKIGLFLVLLLMVGKAAADTMEKREKERQTRLAIERVRSAIVEFRNEVGRCPRSTVELVHPPRTGSRYLRELPRDGFGREMWIRCPGRNDPDAVDVISAGPSGSFTVDDNLQ